MVAGIIVTAAADELVLSRPDAAASAQTSWMILGGSWLFIAGHAAFKAIIWRRVSWPRSTALAIIALLGLLAPHVSALALSACSAVLVVAVALADFVGLGAPADDSSGAA
jgi:low temperature requirement protein LtrA